MTSLSSNSLVNSNLLFQKLWRKYIISLKQFLCLASQNLLNILLLHCLFIFFVPLQILSFFQTSRHILPKTSLFLLYIHIAIDIILSYSNKCHCCIDDSHIHFFELQIYISLWGYLVDIANEVFPNKNSWYLPKIYCTSYWWNASSFF